MIDTLIEDRYRVTERIARQSVVELYRGIDEEDGEVVWIKHWLAPLEDDRAFIENWRVQLLSVQDIEDDQIPAILAFGTSATGALYQVELPPEGMTLRRYAVANAPLPVIRAVGLIGAAARAAGAAHREGVAHGAISPDALYIHATPTGHLEAQLGHWAMGEALAALALMGESLGEPTARYQAPEQRRVPAPPAAPTSDVYALALILYEMLTGNLPERGGVTRHADPLSPPSRFNPDVPPAVDQVLLRSLDPDPALRPPNGLILAAALTEALAEPEVAPPPVVEQRVTTVRRAGPPLWLPAIAALVLLLLCVVATLLWQGSGGGARADLAATATAEAAVVPQLAGPPYLGFNEAVQIAWNRGFVVSIERFVDDPSVPPGVVVAQCPPPASPLGTVSTLCAVEGVAPPSPDTILVTVSNLPVPLVLRVVPELYGQQEDDARRVLAAGGLRVGTRREAYDLLISSGRIVEQNPRRGLAVPGGTAVDLIVSAGPPPSGDALPPGVVLPVEPVSPADPLLPTPLPTPSESPPLLPTEVILPPTESPTPLPLPPTATAEAEETSTVLFEDDFEGDNLARWETDANEGLEITAEGGQFVAILEDAPLFFKSQPGRLFDDFTLSAVITTFDETDRPQDGAGLVLRVQDESHFYYYEINNRGAFRLRARDGDDWVTILDWTEDPAAVTGAADNLLAVRAEEERLTLFLNGAQVAVVDLPPLLTYLAGDIGLAAESVTGPLLVAYDDVVVRR